MNTGLACSPFTSFVANSDGRHGSRLHTVNISMTVQFENEPIRRARVVNLANGLLRNRFGYEPKSRALNGPTFWAKAVLQKTLRSTSWVKRHRKARTPVEFRLDKNHPEQIVDLPKAT